METTILGLGVRGLGVWGLGFRGLGTIYGWLYHHRVVHRGYIGVILG